MKLFDWEGDKRQLRKIGINLDAPKSDFESRRAIVTSGALAGFLFFLRGPDTASAAPQRRPENVGPLIERGGILVSASFPESGADAETTDKSGFPVTNSVGGPSKAYMATPGGALTGESISPEKRKELEGQVQQWNALLLNTNLTGQPCNWFAPEGGWVKIGCDGGMFDIGKDLTVKLPRDGRQYILLVRGRYGDQKQNTDRNTDIVCTDLNPNHNALAKLETGTKGNIGFWSQEQVVGDIAKSHHAGTNAGDGGNHDTVIVFVGIDAKALSVTTHSQDRAGTEDEQIAWAKDPAKYTVKFANYTY